MTSFSFINSKYYNRLNLWFVICFIISNIGALKLCDFEYFQLDAGTFTFPLLYVLNDIITEIYGFSASRKTIYTALFANSLVMAFLYFVTVLPNAQGPENQKAFEQVFFLSPRIIIASISSFAIGELINSSILVALKLKFQGKFFAIRAIFSTFIGGFIESFAFCYLAFFQTISHYELIKMIIILASTKVGYEILIMPITLKLVKFLKEKRLVENGISN